MEDPPLESDNRTKQVQISDELIAEYTIHSMLHTATIEMDPTKLEVLEGFKKTSPGYQYSPQETNIKVIITDQDWSEKKFLVYGSKSTEEARRYIDDVVEKVREIGHSITIQEGPNISNLAINGNFGRRLNLEEIYRNLLSQEPKMEYEPEQFPGLKLPIESPDCTFLLFATGTFVIQGLSRSTDIESAIKKVVKLIFNLN